MPGFLSGMGNLGQLGLGIDRMESNLPVGMYDPNQFINPQLLPYMGMYLQPQMMRAMENFQNPQLMLPQNSGSFLASALGRLFGGGQQQGQQSQGGQVDNNGNLPQNAFLASLYAARNKNIQGGMGAGEAMGQAASQLMADPRFQDPISQAYADRAVQQAVKDGWDPKIAQQARNQLMNFQNTDSGQRQAMTLAQWQAMDPKEQQKWIRAENIPQIATNRFQERKEGGLYVTYETMPDGSQQKVASSTSPQQFIRSQNVNLTGQDLKDPGTLNWLTTGSSHDLLMSSLGSQETFTKNFDDLSQTVEGMLKGGATSGKAGDLYTKADDIIGTIGSFANTVGDTNTFNQVIKGHAGLDDLMGRFKVSGTQAVRLNTALNALTYQYWRAQNPSGRLTPKELVEARDELIGDSSDPNTMIQSIEDKRNILINNFQNAAKNANYVPRWYGSNKDILNPNGKGPTVSNW